MSCCPAPVPAPSSEWVAGEVRSRYLEGEVGSSVCPLLSGVPRGHVRQLFGSGQQTVNMTYCSSCAVTFLCPGVCGKKLCDSGCSGLLFIVRADKVVSLELCGGEPLLL